MNHPRNTVDFLVLMAVAYFLGYLFWEFFGYNLRPWLSGLLS